MKTPAEPTSQRFQDTHLQYILLASATVAILTGFYTCSLKRMLITYVGAVFLGMLVVIPDWEYFTSRHFTEWIEPMPFDAESRKLQKSLFPTLKKTTKYAKREDIHIFGILFIIVSSALTLYFSWKFVRN
ncbi:hypothetical protein KP509_04G068400 [Ceratopteris richardii]|uniref:Signal peptidase complex subunit 1 n=1 Tax=Ceratopteris richardii TaxID=49495 RepID=A0A8T2V5S2_CERRI|nr:hypothetical protein KP509_04G068400 [Ceratopteris richardii]